MLSRRSVLKSAVTAVVLQSVGSASLSPAAQTSAAPKLAQVMADYHEQYLILFPIEATAFGDSRYNDLLPITISDEFLSKEKQFYEQTLLRLKSADRTEANSTELTAAEILEYELKVRLDKFQFHNERIPWTQFDGLPLSFGQLGSGAGNQPFKSVKDYDNFLQRIDRFYVWMQTAIEQFRRGISDNYVLPAKLVRKMIGQCEDKSILSDKPEDCLFYGPIQKLPTAFSAADTQRLKAAYTQAIVEKVQPAYRSMAEFLKKEYLPKARESSGIGALPGGKKQYEYWVRYWTTTTTSPDEIFATGEREVARINAEMESVRKAMKFEGSLKEFFEHIRTGKEFMPYSTPEEILAAFRAIQAKLDPNVDKMFLRRPKTPFEIRRTEAFREKTASAEYQPGSEDGTRPGIFYTPIPDAKSFNVTSGMESLFLHEAIPGHHFQISLQQENAQLPKFARFIWYGAYGEGWALYCESLGKELGLYTDPKQLIGALGDEMHRAIRLVVDVGMHWKGWTREQALEYMMSNEPISEDGAIAEIERYMANPGQALSYKVGALKIRELRSKAENQLGSKFRLAEFHEEVLKDGCMPLFLLEKRIEAWAARKL
ncbi:MAG: DUF885 domain-containing protein [Pirellulales bacterium]